MAMALRYEARRAEVEIPLWVGVARSAFPAYAPYLLGTLRFAQPTSLQMLIEKRPE
ncbi:MAG: hypothetical protein KKG92_08960 [Gammaproteobacteria bacterium]|nr:hypothetical protein [Gammaproteobacteria bacterium]